MREPMEGMRRLLLALLAMGLVGSFVDLLLLEHYEEPWQMLPLGIIALAIACVAWLFFTKRRVALLGVRMVMVAMVAAGVVGVFLHFSGNREFQLEMDPSINGWALFAKALTAKAPPALAPASMISLGLLGLLATYRHPSSAGSTAPERSSRTGA